MNNIEIIYKYDGFLSTDSAKYIKKFGDEGYIYWLELTELPHGMFVWADKNLEQHQSIGEDCMSQEYIKTTALVVGVDNKFAGFKSIKDQRLFNIHYNHMVISIDPFRTQF